MNKKKSYVPIAKIKNALRRIHMHDKQKIKAKARTKIGPALFKCETKNCPVALYEGTSEKNYFKTCIEYGDEFEIHMAKIELDHKIPVIDVKKGYTDWNTYIERLYCSPDGYQAICRDCHAEKTKIESSERKEHGSLKGKIQ